MTGTDNRKKLGQLGEDLAVKYLKKHRYKIVTRNYSSRFGEIDIIALKKKQLILVEVKTRRSRDFGTPEEAVDNHKIEKIAATGYLYQKENKKTPEAIRIDVIAIELTEDDKIKRLEHFKGVGGD